MLTYDECLISYIMESHLGRLSVALLHLAEVHGLFP